MGKPILNKNNEVYFGNGVNIDIKTSKIVTLHNGLKLITLSNGTIPLEVKIEANFDTIPEQYHEVFLNMLSAKYLDVVSFGDNPFSNCVPPPTKKWWEFWKTSLNI
jgi:hypothetical protein